MASETIADIVREMRGVKDWRGDDVPIFTDWADRIEAAAKELADGEKVLHQTLTDLRLEIARLRAALKPVLGYKSNDTCYMDDFNAYGYIRGILDEAQRIYNEREVK